MLDQEPSLGGQRQSSKIALVLDKMISIRLQRTFRSYPVQGFRLAGFSDASLFMEPCGSAYLGFSPTPVAEENPEGSFKHL